MIIVIIVFIAGVCAMSGYVGWLASAAAIARDHSVDGSGLAPRALRYLLPYWGCVAIIAACMAVAVAT